MGAKHLAHMDTKKGTADSRAYLKVEGRMRERKKNYLLSTMLITWVMKQSVHQTPIASNLPI